MGVPFSAVACSVVKSTQSTEQLAEETVETSVYGLLMILFLVSVEIGAGSCSVVPLNKSILLSQQNIFHNLVYYTQLGISNPPLGVFNLCQYMAFQSQDHRVSY